MTRFFTLPQAERLLPEVEAAIREAIAAKAEYQQAQTETQDFQRRVMLEVGVFVDHGKVLDRKQRLESGARRLKEAVERIQECGCLVKDLDIGVEVYYARDQFQHKAWDVNSGTGKIINSADLWLSRLRISRDF